MDSYSTKSALVYDLMQDSRGRSSITHAAEIVRIARMRRPQSTSLLDVACGTGAHLAAFRDEFDEIAGVDASEAMLNRARRRLPGLDLHHGDMRTFDLRRTYDVVTCLLSSVGYMLTLEDL